MIVNDVVKSKKLKYLRQKVARQANKIASMKMVISSLKNNNLLNDDELELFTEQFGKHNDLIKRFVKKGKGQKIPKKYSPELRKLAITLHFHSAKAYNFVRKEFNTIIPHPRTLSKWYSHTKAEPGFTEETIKILTLRAKNSDHTIYCGLIIDEMSIRHHVEWDGNKYHGYVNFGAGFNNDKSDIATECFVFMLVAINESWKIPVGYFLCNHLNSSQKSELIQQCLNLINKTGIKVVSLTFDGCASNINMSKLLGCDLDPTSFKTNFEFKSTDSLTQNIAIFPDPAHMVKLVRNTLGEKNIIIDSDNNIIKFDYLEKLLILQESEGLHLANKLKKQHISFFKQNMKVKLATQLLSRYVADALEFCKNVLCLDEFQSCEPTIKFIRIFNDAFDILNSRNLNSYGKKKALCSQNLEDFKIFKTYFYEYVLNLKFPCGTLVLSSNRKTGFLGFMICFETLFFLHNELIATSCLKFIPCYKISQDHIELFFGAIRSHQGHNNNPTARQFKAAYLKLLIHAETRRSW